MSRTIRFNVDTELLKKAIAEYAKSRGFKNPGAMARVALFEYMRRRPPKDELLRGYLDE